MEWADKRMDDFANRVDDGFKEVKGDIAKLDTKIDAAVGGLRVDLKSDIARVDGRIDKLADKIDKLNDLVARSAVGVLAGIVLLIAGAALKAILGG